MTFDLSNGLQARHYFLLDSPGFSPSYAQDQEVILNEGVGFVVNSVKKTSFGGQEVT